jgi:cardiolipin synthase
MLSKLIKLLLIVGISIFCWYMIIAHPLIGLLIGLIALSFAIRILGSDKTYSSKMLWIVALFINPFLGIMLYATFGHSYKEKTIYTKKTKTDKIFKKYEHQNLEPLLSTYESRILKNLGTRPFYQDTKFEVLQNGDQKFPKLLEYLEQAQDHIHIEYYIFRDGDITTKICDILKQKAEAGIDVRLMYDAVGSKDFSKKEINSLKKSGVKLKSFGKVKIPIFSNKFNFRNHRKIIVIDNKVGFIGGMNISDEYLGYTEKYGDWRDIHLVMTGHAVRELQLTFAKDWYYETNENFIENNEHRYLKEFKLANDFEEIQIVASGPDFKKISIDDVYFKLITSAKDRIMIMTPYFVPGQDIVKALVTSAKNGVKIDIILPGIADNVAVHSVTRTYYDELLKAGIRIYEKNGSFVHGKVLLIDDTTSSIGTVNMDFRSFMLNFEITSFITSKKINKAIRTQFKEDIKVSKKVEREEWEKRPKFNRYGAAIIQFFSPLL